MRAGFLPAPALFWCRWASVSIIGGSPGLAAGTNSESSSSLWWRENTSNLSPLATRVWHHQSLLASGIDIALSACSSHAVTDSKRGYRDS